jgi:hypothetical protein
MQTKRRSSVRRLAAPIILSVGLFPACGGAPTPPTEPPGNPPGPEVQGHENPPGVESKHENPPAPEAKPEPGSTPESPK